MSIQPIEFIKKWKAVELKESAAAHSHFNELCSLLGEETPTDADHDGSWYCFERGATKTTGGEGWADVWKRGCFGWEYKGKRKDLNAAFVQLQQYALALENPPFLVVCDLNRFEIHTNWTNSVSEVHRFALDDLQDAKVRQTLKLVWAGSEKLKPGKTRAELTEEAAAEFATLAQKLRSNGHTPEAVAHFVNRLVFCMFAESAGLLPERIFKRMLEQARRDPAEFPFHGSSLFRAMKEGGWIGYDQVDWFNGGLFDDETAIPLDGEDIALVRRAADRDWSEIDTSIFGTLFERGLDPDKSAQIGSHYTDLEKIRLIVEPTISRPLLAEWETTKQTIGNFLIARPKRRQSRSTQHTLAEAVYKTFLAKLRSLRVLDPACGSGNFLYVALFALKDIEHRVLIDAEAFGFERGASPRIGPNAVLGIEKNLYAAELARVTVWIGEIQWMRRNGFDISRNPILKPLQSIEWRDALLNLDGTAAVWPDADVVIGNPPFLGQRFMLRTLGSEYVTKLRGLYRQRATGNCDLVVYWFIRAADLVNSGKVQRVGFVATNSIRGGDNRSVLDGIGQNGVIYSAWSDEPWINEGAAIRVSIICFAKDGFDAQRLLNGHLVHKISSDLSESFDKTAPHYVPARLSENRRVAFSGFQANGPFDIPGSVARDWLDGALNPNGRPNSDVLRPMINASDLVRRNRDEWIVDFGAMTINAASLYEMPFAHVEAHVKPMRARKREAYLRKRWWLHKRTSPAMRSAIAELPRFLSTPMVSKWRIFVWLQPTQIPENACIVFGRDDDYFFGVLQSKIHEVWSLKYCTFMGAGNDPRYTPKTCFDTFPFPDSLTPDLARERYAQDPRTISIANAAKRLNELRENWLNPSNLVSVEPEIVPGFPDRILPANDSAVPILKNRTLTALYNEWPPWLVNAHDDLNDAVASAYGWPADISHDDILVRLLELNRMRAERDKQFRPETRPSAEQLRREPELPPMPIAGGKRTAVRHQRPLPFDEPLLSRPQPSRRGQRSRRS